MAWTSTKARFREFLGKYGKVAVVVHCSVSAASITGLYIAIKNNVDVESALSKIGLTSTPIDANPTPISNPPRSDVLTDEFVTEERSGAVGDLKEAPKRNRTAELAASSGGALALAVLLNKALFPARVPITIALTPPVARILARRSIMKNSR